jgi:hypothetical protein
MSESGSKLRAYMSELGLTDERNCTLKGSKEAFGALRSPPDSGMWMMRGDMGRQAERDSGPLQAARN